MAKQEKHYEAIITWHKTLEKSDSDKVVIGDTDYASILYKKASAYEKLGFLYLAQKGYKEVLKIEPQHTLAKKHFKTYEKIQESYKLETIQKNIQQFITFEGIRNMETKISILKEIENTEYGNLVKQFAYKKTEEELKSLVIILNDLGYLTTKLGNLSETMEGELNVKLKYYTDAAIFYQYINTIINEKLNEITVEDKMTFITQQKIYPQEQLSHLQDLIFSAIVGTRETMPFFQQEKDNKQSLKKLRNDIDQKLQRAENIRKQAINNQEEKQKYQESYVEEVSNLFKAIADNMEKFLSKLYSDSEQEIGGPPCKYAVIGLGSMALQQMTPYSDLEFAILTENEDYKQSKDPKIKEYFKNLSHMVHFKVINLGESVIPTSRYGVDTSHLVHRGVNFDIGGKTPLGRIDNDKQYELVQTIDGMLAYVRNEKDEAELIDKNLPYILENVCYVHGDKQLVTSYKEEVTKFLTSKSESDEQGRLNCEIRAIKLLKEGTVESVQLQQTPILNFKENHFEGDLQKLAPKFGVESEGRLFDVKQEIYRLPDRIIYNLGLYYSIEGDSNWDIVDKLNGEKVITPEAAFNLKNVLTFATTLRLKTYSCHKTKKEYMSVFSKSAETEFKVKEQAKQMFYLSEEDLGEQGSLFQYFYTALPLYERLEAFCNRYKLPANSDHHAFFHSNDFYVDDHANKGLIYYRLVQYKKAQTNIEQALNEPKYYNNLKLKNVLGWIYLRVNDYERAIEQFDNCLYQLKLIYKEEPHPDVATSLDNLGFAYSAKGQYDRAAKYHEDSLRMMKLIDREEPHPGVVSTLNNLGSAYSAKGQYNQAIRYFEDCLNMMKLIYKEEPHPDVASTLNNLGSAYSAKGQCDQAIRYFESSLKMKKLIYKEEPHPDVASILNNLGIAYSAKGQYDQAIRYFEDSLNMMKLICKEEPHPDVASFLNNQGVAYSAKGQYDITVPNDKEMWGIMSKTTSGEERIDEMGRLLEGDKDIKEVFAGVITETPIESIILKMQEETGEYVKTFSANNVTKEQRQLNHCMFKKVEKLVTLVSELEEQEVHKYFMSEGVSLKHLLNSLYCMHAFASYDLYDRHNGQIAREIILSSKKLVEQYVLHRIDDEFKDKVKTNFGTLNKDKIYIELDKFKHLPEMYTSIIYLLGRTYIYQGNKNDGEKYFELSKYLGEKLGLFEGYLSDRSGLGVIKMCQAEEYIKKKEYQQAESKLNEAIELYKELKVNNTSYKNEYKPIGEGEYKEVTPTKDAHNQVECSERLIKCYMQLLMLPNNEEKHAEYVSELSNQFIGSDEFPGILKQLKDIAPKKIASICNSLGQTLLNLFNKKGNFKEFKEAIVKELQLPFMKEGDFREETDLSFIKQIFTLAESKTMDGDFAKADAHDGISEVCERQLKQEEVQLNPLLKKQLEDEKSKHEKIRDEINEALNRGTKKDLLVRLN